MGIPEEIAGERTPGFIHELLYRMKIRDVMTRKLVSARRSDSLRHAQQLMKQNTITGLPVVEGSRLLGIVSMDDIIRALEGGWIDSPIEQHMTRNVTVLEDDMPLAFALSYMEKYHYGRFPVLERTGELAGIITSRDIIVHLLMAMTKEMELLEAKLDQKKQQDAAQAATGGEAPGVMREYLVRKFDFENAGKPSSEIKRLCQDAGIDAKTVRRIAVASYELEMNQVIHSIGGSLEFSIKDDRAYIVAADKGPGIPDVEKALTEGFSTATEWIRSLGFGAGMGLPNTKRVSDEFEISSELTRGTTVRCTFHLPKRE